MKRSLKKIFRRTIAALATLMILLVSIPACAQEKADNADGLEQYVTVEGHKMHVILYGDITEAESGVSFTDQEKSTLVMLPALGVPSPNIYFKPLAQELDDDFNVIVVEPLGYGLSDLADSERNVTNINRELYQALEALDVDECILAVHSISGVYGLNFVLDHPDMVKGFIAIDNTVYDDELAEAFVMEQEYMQNGIKEFETLRNSFPSVKDFQDAIAQNPAEYGADLPQITGYTYSNSDKEEYFQAYARGFNNNIKDEVSQMNKSLLTIKGKKFPDTLPVLTMVSADNAANMPVWETAHYAQLNLQSGNHEIYILQGSHYIWYTNLSGVVDHIEQWQTGHDL